MDKGIYVEKVSEDFYMDLMKIITAGAKGELINSNSLFLNLQRLRYLEM